MTGHPQDDGAVPSPAEDAAPSVVGGGAPEAPPEAIGIYGPYLDGAERYAALLADTGVSHGLIGPREVERLWERHILNCGVVATLIDDDLTVVDVGSGAGLPGLAIAIARPDLEMHLVEPMARRVAWLDDTVRDLGLDNVIVHRGRAEEVTVIGDVVTARAVSKLSTLAGWMAPLVREGGSMLALKGASARKELARDQKAATRAGWDTFSIITVGEDILDHPTTVVRATYRGAQSVKGVRRRR